LITKSKKWFPQIFPDIKYNSTDHKWVWPTGEELILAQFNRDDDYYNYHGHEYPFIGWDELTNWPNLNAYKRMISCCRSSNQDVPRMIRSTTNPYGPGHNAVKHYFELPHKDGIIRRRKYHFTDALTNEVRSEQLCRLAIKGTVYENTILLKAQPTYIAQLKQSARNEAELRAWLEGDWDIVAGGMFDDVWDANKNIVVPFKIPHTWRVDRSFDWGSSAPFSVGWWAESDGSDYQDEDGNWHSTVRGDLFRIGEWYGWTGEPNEGLRMLNSEVAKGIRERELERWPELRVRPGPADNQITNIYNGTSIAMDMQAPIRLDNGQMVPGIQWMRSDKAAGSRKTGWEKMRKMLRNAHPKEGCAREYPGIFVFNNCTQFIRTVPVLPRSDKDLDDINSEAEDHIADETRYRILAGGRTVRSGTTVGLA
jgi:cytochrome b involved in lipid metabolism